MKKFRVPSFGFRVGQQTQNSELETRNSKPTAQKSAWQENIESLLWALALALLIRTFIMAPFKIPSGSMRMTLIEGDRILVSKFIYRLHAPRRGDIVVFYHDWQPFRERLFDRSRPLLERLFTPGRPFIKRLIGVGGDRVEIREGQVWVNDQRVSGHPIFETNHYYNQGPYGGAGHTIHVPADAYFVLGDNSALSNDSRYWGFVPKRLMIGEAVCIFWPVTRWRILR